MDDLSGTIDRSMFRKSGGAVIPDSAMRRLRFQLEPAAMSLAFPTLPSLQASILDGGRLILSLSHRIFVARSK
jgi:hypothetical protein